MTSATRGDGFEMGVSNSMSFSLLVSAEPLMERSVSSGVVSFGVFSTAHMSHQMLMLHVHHEFRMEEETEIVLLSLGSMFPLERLNKLQSVCPENTDSASTPM